MCPGKLPLVIFYTIPCGKMLERCIKKLYGTNIVLTNFVPVFFYNRNQGWRYGTGCFFTLYRIFRSIIGGIFVGICLIDAACGNADASEGFVETAAVLRDSMEHNGNCMFILARRHTQMGLCYDGVPDRGIDVSVCLWQAS